VRAAPLILNYIVAYHCLRRVTEVQAGQTALLIGASGGIGSAFLQLGHLSGLNMYALASPGKHDLLERYHAYPIDYRGEDYVAFIRAQVPQGLDWVFDGVGGAYIRDSFALLRPGGKLVSYANPFSMRRLVIQLSEVLLLGLLPNGRSTAYYSTGRSYLNRQPFLDDWATLFELLNSGKIDPVIASTYPLEKASAANAALESGRIAGNLVLDLTSSA
jgi:NADPH:quinone reductase-like Zn-dependent oxidoreductase